MSYQTGSAASYSDLRDALTTFAVAAGWSWDATHEVLHKGASYVGLTIPTGQLQIIGGTGVSSGVLTGQASGFFSRITSMVRDMSHPHAVAFPLTYHLFAHNSPDDIVLLVNYSGNYWQWLGFGQATNLGLAGNATWYGATVPASDCVGVWTYSGGGDGGGISSAGAPFWGNPDYRFGIYNSSFIHGQLDGMDWLGSVQSFLPVIYQGATDLLNASPSAWSGDSPLLHASITFQRPSSLFSIVADLPHLRLLRNDNYNDGDIIDLTPDKWFVVPFFRKNAAARVGADSSNYDHSGTLAMAIRYDGP